MDPRNKPRVGLKRNVRMLIVTSNRLNEPYSPWQNAAESAIRELKKAAGRKMVRAGVLKPF
jgi:hypothetical protein